MVFKLIRTDIDNSAKIELRLGTSQIGRGKLLDCDDKRISRHHGNLVVTGDSVSIEAVHQNPCFFTRKGTTDIKILKKSNSETLYNGDKFGLLPGSYWFEVLEIFSNISSQTTDQESTQVYLENNNVNKIEFDDNTLENKETSDEDAKSVANVNSTTEAEEQSNNSDVVNFDFNETVDEGSAESPSILDPIPNGPGDQQENQSATDEHDKSPITDHVPKSPSPSKRSHDTDCLQEELVKKIKAEPGDVKHVPDSAVTAGPSNDLGGPNAGNIAAPGSPVKPPRERCIYGAGCYRKNPQHKAQFSHPSDADWGSGERGVCPYGARCRRRDPRHWRLHHHPLNAAPPPRQDTPGPAQKKPKRVRHRASSDEDTPQQDLVLNGKRTRKPLQMQDIGSESEEDPYHTDDSEDWQPSTRTQSQDTDDY